MSTGDKLHKANSTGGEREREREKKLQKKKTTLAVIQASKPRVSVCGPVTDYTKLTALGKLIDSA